MICAGEWSRLHNEELNDFNEEWSRLHNEELNDLYWGMEETA